jgi:transcriptional regulator with XRE-family HTH domain
VSESPSDQQPVFSVVLSRAVRERGLSLDRIRARLEAAGVPVSNATLSYWQSGRSLPTRARSLRTLVELETILQLEPGTLIELIRTADGRTRHQLFSWQSVVPSGVIAEQIIGEMGMEVAGRISRVTVHDTLTMDADRCETLWLSRQVLRAERSGVQTFPVVVQGEESAEPGSPEIEPVFGCAVGRLVDVPERQLTVAEMLLPRPLQRGELVLTEYLVTMKPAPSLLMTRSCFEPVREVALAVQFHPAALPVEVFSFTQTSLNDPQAPETDVRAVPVHECQVQTVRLDAAPGVYGLRWSWD